MRLQKCSLTEKEIKGALKLDVQDEILSFEKSQCTLNILRMKSECFRSTSSILDTITLLEEEKSYVCMYCIYSSTCMCSEISTTTHIRRVSSMLPYALRAFSLVSD